ncbi:MAG: hypothetical protein IPN76_19975 [Saprospiraceae bacterium]|nr:hypothetical protein [Saprospiraceae bacterium]
MNVQNLFVTLLIASVLMLPTAKADNPMPHDGGLKINIKMYLQGALLGVKSSSKLMRDDLRTAGIIPLNEPYSSFGNYSHYGDLGGTEVIENPEVLKVEGPDAIVDWVFVELRHPDLQKIVLATRSALLQRDGDVVDVDGISPLVFMGLDAGSYMVAVRHRNHLGVMSATTYAMSDVPQLVDFTDSKGKFLGGKPMIQIADKMALFAGDANQDGVVNIQGPNNDKDKLFFDILYFPDNVDANYTHIIYGYNNCDVNLDGEVKYQGPKSDGSYLAFDIVFLWEYSCPNVDKDCRLVEELP